VLHYTWLERLANDKHSSYCGQSLLTKKMKHSKSNTNRLRNPGTKLHFPHNLQMGKYAGVLLRTRLERLANKKHLIIVTYEENEVLQIQILDFPHKL
jgi:hypothetical protein